MVSVQTRLAAVVGDVVMSGGATIVVVSGGAAIVVVTSYPVGKGNGWRASGSGMGRSIADTSLATSACDKSVHLRRSTLVSKHLYLIARGRGAVPGSPLG